MNRENEQTKLFEIEMQLKTNIFDWYLQRKYQENSSTKSLCKCQITTIFIVIENNDRRFKILFGVFSD
jgi:hypothetical protein